MHFKSTCKAIQLLLVAFMVLPVISACSPEVDTRSEVLADLKEIMVLRKQAIENKDIVAYKKLFLPKYWDGGIELPEIIADMENHFATSETISFNYEKNPMNFKMNTARMVSMVSYQTDKMEKPAYHHEKTIFRRVDGKWTISSGVAIGLF